MLTLGQPAWSRWLIIQTSSAYESRGKKDDAAQQSEHPVDGNADDPKWKQQDPDERIEEKREQRQGPAEHEQDAPKQEFHRTRLYEAHR